jgi:hypothetical protein
MAVETVTVLDRGEPYEAMVSDAGLLWVGKSRQQFSANYQLEVYESGGSLIDRKTLTHSLSTMKLASSGEVIITGINPNLRLTEYTSAKLQNGKIQASTKTVDIDGFITFWIGKIGNTQYFVDIGGNPNDTSDPGQHLPAQTIFSSKGTNVHYLPARVSMPVAGAIAGGKLLMVSSEGISQDGSTIVEVDHATSAIRVITKSASARYRGIQYLDSTKELLTLASRENKLKVIDSVSGEILREFSTDGFPRSFVTFGHCVIVGGDQTNVVEAFDLNRQSDLPVFSTKVDLPADEFSGIKSLAIDKNRGDLFARSSYACNPIIEACDKDNNRVIKFDSSTASELTSACK